MAVEQDTPTPLEQEVEATEGTSIIESPIVQETPKQSSGPTFEYDDSHLAPVEDFAQAGEVRNLYTGKSTVALDQQTELNQAINFMNIKPEYGLMDNVKSHFFDFGITNFLYDSLKLAANTDKIANEKITAQEARDIYYLNDVEDDYQLTRKEAELRSQRQFLMMRKEQIWNDTNSTGLATPLIWAVSGAVTLANNTIFDPVGMLLSVGGGGLLLKGGGAALTALNKLPATMKAVRYVKNFHKSVLTDALDDSISMGLVRATNAARAVAPSVVEGGVYSGIDSVARDVFMRNLYDESMGFGDYALNFAFATVFAGGFNYWMYRNKFKTEGARGITSREPDLSGKTSTRADIVLDQLEPAAAARKQALDESFVQMGARPLDDLASVKVRYDVESGFDHGFVVVDGTNLRAAGAKTSERAASRSLAVSLSDNVGLKPSHELSFGSGIYIEKAMDSANATNLSGINRATDRSVTTSRGRINSGSLEGETPIGNELIKRFRQIMGESDEGMSNFDKRMINNVLRKLEGSEYQHISQVYSDIGRYGMYENGMIRRMSLSDDALREGLVRRKNKIDEILSEVTDGFEHEGGTYLFGLKDGARDAANKAKAGLLDSLSDMGKRIEDHIKDPTNQIGVDPVHYNVTKSINENPDVINVRKPKTSEQHLEDALQASRRTEEEVASLMDDVIERVDATFERGHLSSRAVEDVNALRTDLMEEVQKLQRERDFFTNPENKRMLQKLERQLKACLLRSA